MTRWGQVQNTETTNTIHRSNRSNSALSIAPMFNLTTNLLCHKTSQQAATVQQLPSTELCLRIVWLSDGPAPRRWSPVKVSMELWARHMGRHCVVDKIVTFWGREFPFFSGWDGARVVIIDHESLGLGSQHRTIVDLILIFIIFAQIQFSQQSAVLL